MDIRQYNKYGEKIYPTKLGIQLSGAQLANLLSFREDISNDVKEFRANKVESFKYIIGDGVHITASGEYPCIHIRFYYQNALMPFALPTKTGIALRFDEWDVLVSLIEKTQKLMESRL